MTSPKQTGTSPLWILAAVFSAVTGLLWATGWILRTSPAHAGAAPEPRVLTLHGFSLVDELLMQGLFPSFQEQWRLTHGEEIKLVGRFASLGQVTNELVAGAPADLAVLSAEVGLEELINAGVISAQRQAGLPNRGVFGRSPVVIVARPGNPQGIHDFNDVARPGIQVVQPDPSTSGSALWVVLAEFGAGKRRAGNWKDGREQILGIRRNMVGKAASGFEARNLFESGMGDVLVTLEQDALQSLRSGKLHGVIVYPRSTIVSEPSLAIMEKSLSSRNSSLVMSFAEFFWSAEAQRILLSRGFRAVQETGQAGSEGFRQIEDPFVIQDLGGWRAAKREIIDGIWLSRSVTQ